MSTMLCTMLNWDAHHLLHPLGHALHWRGQRVVVSQVSRATRQVEAHDADPFNLPGMGEIWIPETELNTAVRMARAALLDHLICVRLEEHFGPSFSQQVTINAAGRSHTELVAELMALVESHRRLQRLVLWVQVTGDFGE